MVDACGVEGLFDEPLEGVLRVVANERFLGHFGQRNRRPHGPEMLFIHGEDELIGEEGGYDEPLGGQLFLDESKVNFPVPKQLA